MSSNQNGLSITRCSSPKLFIAQELFGDGSMLRDFTYIDDILDGIASAATSPKL